MHLHFDAVVRVTGSHQILSWDLDFQKFYFPDQITCICWFTWELWSGERNGSCYKKKISFFHEIWLLVCMIFESLGMILALICRETSARKHLRIYCSHEIQWLQFLVSLIYAPRLLIRYIFPDSTKKVILSDTGSEEKDRRSLVEPKNFPKLALIRYFYPLEPDFAAAVWDKKTKKRSLFWLLLFNANYASASSATFSACRR